MNGRSNKQIHHIITKLDDQQCKELIDAMRTVKKHLSIATKNIIVRCFQNKDIEYVIDRQLSLYVSERQFTRQIWKNISSKEYLSFIEQFDEKKDAMFIVECDGEAVGCIAVKYTRNNMAQLRYFFLELEMRGAPVLEEFVILRQAAPISMYLIHWKPHGYEVFSAGRVCRRSDLKQGMQQLI